MWMVTELYAVEHDKSVIPNFGPILARQSDAKGLKGLCHEESMLSLWSLVIEIRKTIQMVHILPPYVEEKPRYSRSNFFCLHGDQRWWRVICLALPKESCSQSRNSLFELDFVFFWVFSFLLPMWFLRPIVRRLAAAFLFVRMTTGAQTMPPLAGTNSRTIANSTRFGWIEFGEKISIQSSTNLVCSAHFT